MILLIITFLHVNYCKKVSDPIQIELNYVRIIFIIIKNIQGELVRKE